MADENEKIVRLEEKSCCGTPPPILRSTREMICRETIHGLVYQEHEYFHSSRKLPTNIDDVIP
jgi:hypothetical protein